MVDAREDEVSALLDRARRSLRHQLDRADSELTHTHARVVALSPAATLRRGYALLQRSDGHAVRAPDEVAPGDELRARVSEGEFTVRVDTEGWRMTGKKEQTEAVVEALGDEQARDELVEVVRRLETGGTTLEESLALWERGEELARVCRRWLEGARAGLDAAVAEEEKAAGAEETGEAG